MRRQVLPIRGSGYPSRREMGAVSQRARDRTTTCASRAPAGDFRLVRDPKRPDRREPRTAQRRRDVIGRLHKPHRRWFIT